MKEYRKVAPKSDASKKMPPPIFQKPYPDDSELIDLVSPSDFTIGDESFIELVNQRESRRKYTNEFLNLEELSFLLWTTQGVKKVLKKGVFRTVPSSGAKSPFETYLVVNKVEGLKAGLYRYISFSHKLYFVKTIENSEQLLSDISFKQKFVRNAAVNFCWVAVPARTEYKYTIFSPKFIAIDLGIVCQNLYLACEAINLGTVAIVYYEQDRIDELFELDGEDEFVVMLAPVGKVKKL